MTAVTKELETKGQAARQAARSMASLSSAAKDRALNAIAAALRERKGEIVAANGEDMSAGKEAGLSEAFLDRLLLTNDRIETMAADVEHIAPLPDPVGEMFDARTLPNGLRLARRRVPLGVIAAIYESRPDVTIEIASLCLKSGNACLLRGGKEAIRSSTILASVVRDAIAVAGLPNDAVQIVENTERSTVGEMLKMRGIIDLMVPRGGSQLVHLVTNQATMPVLAGGLGVCHTYVDESADPGMAVRITDNAKRARPSACNALDTVLVHKAVAPNFLPSLGRRWAEDRVEMRCDEESLRILQEAGIPDLSLQPAQEEDFGQEFLALVASVKTVASLDEALDHIAEHGSGHSEAVITSDYTAAQRFLDEVDAAAVYVNASTRYTDGGQFGLGAEVGISTQKVHARGPMGLRELTSYKWIVQGDGQVRW